MEYEHKMANHYEQALFWRLFGKWKKDIAVSEELQSKIWNPLKSAIEKRDNCNQIDTDVEHFIVKG